MKKTLLLTTALLTSVYVLNAKAEDLNITEDKNITQKGMLYEVDGLITNHGTIENKVSKEDEGDINISSENMNIKTYDAAIEHSGTGDINIKNDAVINVESSPVNYVIDFDGIDGSGNSVSYHEEVNPGSLMAVHKGQGDINITDNAQIIGDGIIEHIGTGDINVSSNASFVADELAGLIHGGEGDINVSDNANVKGAIQIGGSTGRVSQAVIGDGDINISGHATVDGVIGHSGQGDINISDNAVFTSIDDPVERQEELAIDMNMPYNIAIWHQNDGDINISDKAKAVFENSGIYKRNPNLTTQASGDINISDEAEVIFKNGGIITDAAHAGNINIKGGKVNLDSSGIRAVGRVCVQYPGGEYTCGAQSKEDLGQVNISGGEVNLKNESDITGYGDINISGGKVTLKDSAIRKSDFNAPLENLDVPDISGRANINITGGEVSLEDSVIAHEDTGDINISGDAKIIASEKSNTVGIIDGKPLSDGIYHMKTGDLNISGHATVKNGSLVTGSTLETTGDINISENANLNNVSIVKLGTGDVNISDNAVFSYNGPKDGKLYDDDEYDAISLLGDGDINISGGQVDLNSVGIWHSGTSWGFGDNEITEDDADSINISGGEINLKNSEEFKTKSYIGSNGNINISGGKINLNNGTDIEGIGKVNITGGQISLQGDNQDAASVFSNNDLNISGTDTVINLKGNANINTLESEHLYFGKNNEYPAEAAIPNYMKPTDDSLKISDGATINVTGRNNVLGAEKDVTLSDATINVNTNSDLKVIDEIDGNASTLTLDYGTVNLNGKLDAGVSGAGNINFKSNKGVVTGDLANSTLNFDASHALSSAVKGNLNNQAKINVNKGTLTYDKNVGKISTVTVGNGATLDVGTNTVKANSVEFQDKSKLGVRVKALDDHGLVKADNIAIGANTTMNVTLDKGIVRKGETQEIKLLDGNIDGNFTNKIANNNRYQFNFDDENGSLQITGSADVKEVVKGANGNKNHEKTADAWDNFRPNETSSENAKKISNALNDLSQTDEKAYVEALTALAPDTAPSVHTTRENANQVFGAVNSRLNGGTAASRRRGMSSGDNDTQNAAVWVQGLRTKAEMDDTKKSKGFDAETNGVAMGIEGQVTNNTKVGIGYAYSDTSIEGYKRDTDVDTHTAIVYGEYKPSSWFLNAIASYGWSDYDEVKNVAGVRVKDSYDVNAFGMQIMTGYDFATKWTMITPEIGLRYIHITQDDYKDSADQKISGQTSNLLTAVLGTKLTQRWIIANSLEVRPEIKAAITYDLTNDPTNSVVTLPDGSNYKVEGEAMKRFGLELGAGLVADVSDNAEVSLGYEGKFKDHYEEHSGLFNAKYKF